MTQGKCIHIQHDKHIPGFCRMCIRTTRTKQDKAKLMIHGVLTFV